MSAGLWTCSRTEVPPVSMTRRLARLEARARPAPGHEDDERAREELARRLDRLRERMIETGDLYEDDGAVGPRARVRGLGELPTKFPGTNRVKGVPPTVRRSWPLPCGHSAKG